MREDFLSDQTGGPSSTITEAFSYGVVTCELTLHGTPWRVMASDEQLQTLIRFARKRIKERVAPALEELVEESGAPIDPHNHTHTKNKGNIEAQDVVLSTSVDCETVAMLPDQEEVQVKQIFEHELNEPLREFINARAERGNAGRLVRAVRSVFTDLRGRSA